MKNFPPYAVRAWIYGIALAAVPVLVYTGVMEPEGAALALPLALAVRRVVVGVHGHRVREDGLVVDRVVIGRLPDLPKLRCEVGLAARLGPRDRRGVALVVSADAADDVAFGSVGDPESGRNGAHDDSSRHRERYAAPATAATPRRRRRREQNLCPRQDSNLRPTD